MATFQTTTTRSPSQKSYGWLSLIASCTMPVSWLPELDSGSSVHFPYGAYRSWLYALPNKDIVWSLILADSSYRNKLCEQDDYGDTPMHILAGKINTLKSVFLYLLDTSEGQAALCIKNNRGCTPLHLFDDTIARHLDVLRKVLSTESGQRAALMVSDSMELPLVRYYNATYYFPLNFSSAVAEAFLASEFLQNMLKIQGAQGLTLVHFAAQREWEGFRRMGRPMPIGHPHFIELFLKYPAGREALEIQDDLGSTPLHIAAAWTYYVGIESIINQTMSAKIFTMKTTSGHTFADLFIGSEVSYFGDNTQAIARREAIELAKQRCITLQTADSKQKKSVEKSLRYLQSLD